MKVLLKVLSGPDSGKQFSSAQADKVTVGRGQACQIQLTDPSVSRTHFEISYEQGHFLLTDLGSAGGVLINGGKADEKRLRHGDRIQVGKTEISVALVGGPEDDTYDSSSQNR